MTDHSFAGWTTALPAGRKLEGAARNLVGSLDVLSEATPERVALAARHFRQVDPSELR
jgi:hypothetical protein